ncbi:ABC transporter substrate-binding protein [Kineosporia sp. NBRC 101731]|uniref:ABC transporter substrate-binding protein n=1 Tax=Kineosporia sp. NBRC 101731 TaxID=3032199 RepID=UPI0024A1BDC8|nr:ABC transporter substrate-binding protein [Kineosporia sp. NBRC 101731]GLY32184.1 ABC transporter substrate-binding protein [Kineosporia sp. NBRC 101731]
MTKTLTRRRMAAPAAVLVALLALVGCGSSSDGDSGESGAAAGAPASALMPAGEGTTQYPMTLTSPWGETVLEKRPERIAIVTGANDMDNTLALGVTPVFADKYMAEYEWAADAGASKIENLGEITDVIPFEAVAASKPDLLIAIQTDAAFVGDSYKKLSQIAPVLVAPETSWDVTWQESVKLIGQTLDLSAKADDVIADVEAKVAQEKAAHPEFSGKSISFVEWHAGMESLTYRSFTGSATAEVFGELGFVPSEAASQFSRDSLLVSKENYSKLDADVLMLAASKDLSEDIQSEPVFKAIPAVADGRFALLDTEQEPSAGWAMSWPSALSLPWITALVTPKLADAVQ